MSISLKEEHSKIIFPILAGQDSTELDILFINSPTQLGHEATLNYYIEVETQRRDPLAFQRLIDFSNFCKSRKIDLFPILITNIKGSGYVQEICVFNIDDLAKSGIYYERYLKNLEQIPGLSYDDAACCLYILDLVSERERFMKEELFVELKNHQVLKRKSLNLKRLVNENEISLGDCLEFETSADFNRRLNEYLKLLKEKKLLVNTVDGRAHQLTSLGAQYIIKWRSEL